MLYLDSKSVSDYTCFYVYMCVTPIIVSFLKLYQKGMVCYNEEKDKKNLFFNMSLKSDLGDSHRN